MFLFNASPMPDVRFDLMEEGNAGGGGRIPGLADILASLRIAPSGVVVHLAPDHRAWNGEAVADTGDPVLMLRHATDLRPQQPFALSPMAEF